MLLKAGEVGVEELKDAFTDQVIKGGTLDSALLERGVDEGLLLAFLARASGFPPMPAILHREVDPRVATLIAAETADRLKICPIRQHADHLVVLASERADPFELDAFAAERHIQLRPYAATELRVQQAASAVYARPLPARFADLLRELGSDPPPAKQIKDNVASQPKQPPAAATATRSAEYAPVVTDIGSRQPLSAVRIEQLSIGEAVQRILTAATRNDLLSALTRAAHGYLSPLGVFLTKDNALTGFSLVDDGQQQTVPPDKQPRVEVLTGSILNRVVGEGSAYVGPWPDEPDSAAIRELLGAAPYGQQCLIAAVRLKQRTVCVLAGAARDPGARNREPLLTLTQTAAAGFADLIVRQKSPRATEPPPSRVRQRTPVKRRPRKTRPSRPGGLSPITSGEINSRYTRVTPAKASPKVIVELGPDLSRHSLDQLLYELGRDDARGREAIAELKRRGDSVLSELAQRFPGKLTVDLHKDPLPPASECGPVLRGLVALGRSALAQLANHLQVHHADTRVIATHVLAELPIPESLALLDHCVRDPDARVRHTALRALDRLRKVEGYTRVLQGLRVDLASSIPARRQLAIDGLAALKDLAALPSVVALLHDPDPGVVSTAHQALVALTKQDFGDTTRAWMSWWERNHHRHRIEWLIESLTHEHAALRQAALSELNESTGLNFGQTNDPTGPNWPELRRRYLAWWADGGAEQMRSQFA